MRLRGHLDCGRAEVWARAEGLYVPRLPGWRVAVLQGVPAGLILSVCRFAPKRTRQRDPGATCA